MNKVTFKPIGNKVVLVAIEKKEETTEAGIMLPENVQQVPTIGKVVAVNHSWQSTVTGTWITATVKVGDYVVIKQENYDGIKIGNEKYIIASEHELLSIIEEKKDDK